MATYKLKDVQKYNNGFFRISVTGLIHNDKIDGINEYIYENLLNGKVLIVTRNEAQYIPVINEFSKNYVHLILLISYNIEDRDIDSATTIIIEDDVITISEF